ncbi:hypothetical protein Fmac_030464 [Flemingia macrophylla]|uniref:Uncharacterized protein n=1 Tax=Flemingia macrophylla TaxID=520843 RepID=A0ABD1KZ96_9FABA
MHKVRNLNLFCRSTSAGIVPDSQVVEQSDRQIEYWRGTSPSQKIQNVDNSIQEVSHLIDKEGSDDRMVAPRNENQRWNLLLKF